MTEPATTKGALVSKAKKRKMGSTLPADLSSEETERRFGDLFENSPIGIYRSTTDGRIVVCNPALIRMLRYESLQEIASVDVAKAIYHPDNPRKRFVELIEKHGEVRGFEVKWLRKDGVTLHVRENSRAIRDEKGKIVFFEGTVEDISEQKLAELRLAWQLKLQRMLTEISSTFVNQMSDDIDAAVVDALKKTGQLTGVDRSYVFRLSKDGATMSNTHEWVAASVSAEMLKLQSLDTKGFAWLIKQLRNKEVVQIPKVEELPEEASVEREEFARENIRSLILIPLISGASVIGFLGYDSVKRQRSWDEDLVNAFKLLGEIIASAMGRQESDKAVQFRLVSESLLASVSAKFANLLPTSAEMDTAISQVVAAVGGFAQVDRAFLLIHRPGTNYIEKMNVWTASERTRSTDSAKPAVFHDHAWTLRMLRMQEIISVKSLSELPKDAKAEKEYHAGQGVKSFLLVPWMCSDGTVGCLGLAVLTNERDWDEGLSFVVRIAADMVGGAIEKKLSCERSDRELELVEALMSNMPDKIYFKDRDCRFLRANRAMIAGQGFSSMDELKGKTDFDLFTMKHAQQAFDDDNEVMRTKRPIIAKEEIETLSDGSEKWVSSTKVPMFDENGNVVGLMGISRDITENKRIEEDRRRLEKHMMQTQKMESLGLMCGGIAHDFNNFLMGILGNSGLALMEMTQESPSWNSVKQIETMALRAADLTAQLLAYAGRTESVKKAVNISILVKEMTHLLKLSISSNINLVYSLSEHMGMVECDPAQVRQVAMNLIINAAEAIGQTGTIGVATGVARMDRASLAECFCGDGLVEGDYAFIEVSDTGCGMDKKTIERVFDPFFTTKPTGHGLGMAVVMGVMKAHGGAIRITSEKGKGTTIRVMLCYLPVDAGEQQVIEPESVRGRKGGQVLVVDDDEIVRGVAARILQSGGFSAVVVKDGNDAVHEIETRDGNFDAVLLDMTLPGESGDSVCERIRKVASNIPVIAMSGYGAKRMSDDSENGNYRAFIGKPFTADSLVALVRKVVDNK